MIVGVAIWRLFPNDHVELFGVGESVSINALPASAGTAEDAGDATVPFPISEPALQKTEAPVLPSATESTPEKTIAPEPPAIAPVVKAEKGTPARIKISSIALNARVENVALTKDGAMDVPKDPNDAGWYELGPRPGEIGSAVIDGHVDWLHGDPAVFINLHKVKIGDKIVVQNDNGTSVTFIVRETRLYDADADATDIFLSDDGKAHLNIITCHGEWDKDDQQYLKRLVVFTDKVEE